MRSNASGWVLALGTLFGVACSGTAGELFPDGAGGDPAALGGSGRGGVAVGRGGVGAGGSSSGAAASTDPTPLGVGNNPGLGGAAGGPNASAGGASGMGSGSAGNGEAGEGAADAGPPPVVPPLPPVCDPCPCSTGPFGEPELVTGLGTSSPVFGPAPSADGLTLFFSVVDASEDIVLSTRTTRGREFSTLRSIAAVNGANTEEGTPFISADDRSLFFFSMRPDPRAPGGRDLWVSTRSGAGGEFSEPALVSDVNTADLEHLPRLTPDGLTLLFVSGRDDGESLGSNVWQARRESLTQPFGPARELPGVNSDARDEGFWLSADGLTVFVASNRLVQNDMDIYVATRPNVDSAFRGARNMDEVNTSSQELDPALTLDGFELFFASDRSGTMRLYRSQRQCD